MGNSSIFSFLTGPLLNYFRGVCMGIADLIPGISGGTIAFLFGIYEELINSLSAVDAHFLRLVARRRGGEAFRHINGVFLCAVFGGDITAILVLSRLVHWLIVHQPILLKAFFFGLIVATIPIIAQRIKRWSGGLMTVFVLATAGMFVLSGLMPITTPTAGWFIFLSGAVAICAMILPGISGAFILVLLGKYEFMIAALSRHDFGPVLIMLAGVIVGLLTFVRFLRFLFHRYHDLIVALLTGLVAGSLRKVWPWKKVLAHLTTASGKVIPLKEANVLPASVDAQLLIALALMIAGFVLAYQLARIQPGGGRFLAAEEAHHG